MAEGSVTITFDGNTKGLEGAIDGVNKKVDGHRARVMSVGELIDNLKAHWGSVGSAIASLDMVLANQINRANILMAVVHKVQASMEAAEQKRTSIEQGAASAATTIAGAASKAAGAYGGPTNAYEQDIAAARDATGGKVEDIGGLVPSVIKASAGKGSRTSFFGSITAAERARQLGMAGDQAGGIYAQLVASGMSGSQASNLAAIGTRYGGEDAADQLNKLMRRGMSGQDVIRGMARARLGTDAGDAAFRNLYAQDDAFVAIENEMSPEARAQLQNTRATNQKSSDEQRGQATRAAEKAELQRQRERSGWWNPFVTDERGRISEYRIPGVAGLIDDDNVKRGLNEQTGSSRADPKVLERIAAASEETARAQRMIERQTQAASYGRNR